MTDSANIFSDKENVGSLFDGLWYNATRAVLAAEKQKDEDDGVPAEGYLQRARELAIGDAHKRYKELNPDA